jgi:hypothetical protein
LTAAAVEVVVEVEEAEVAHHQWSLEPEHPEHRQEGVAAAVVVVVVPPLKHLEMMPQA